ncbi:MAG TPA: hypothetical protein VG407_03455 [Caulobacteraceae bacterium]|nr:hypothetical protein [Caulobacteraceae bacterium]
MSIRPSRAVLIAALCLAAAACHRTREEKPQGQITTTTQQASGENPPAPVLVPGLTCNSAGFLTETANPGVAKVVTSEVHFITDHGDGCPSDGPACQAKSFVMRGDTVMTGVANGPYVCAFSPAKGGIAGWVKPSDITEASVPSTPPLEAWAGAWRLGDTVITLAVRDNNLVADGTAPIAGAPIAAVKPAVPADANAAAPAAPTAPPAGKMSGVAQPVGDTVEFAAADPNGCRVDLRLIGPFLAAKDNGQCGGQGRFAGVFRKPSATPVGGAGKSGAASKSNPNKNVFY